MALAYQLAMLPHVFIVALLVSACLTDSTEFAGNKEVHDQAHIKQHLENKIEVENLTDEQQRFHYFSMHDLDKDQRIDGIEIMKALTHDHEHDTGPGISIENEDSMVTMVDAVLADLDLNGDGYVDFAEYTLKQKGKTP